MTPWLDVIQTAFLGATLMLVVYQLRQVHVGQQRDATDRAAEDIDRFNELMLAYPQLNRSFYPPGAPFHALTLDEQAYYNFLNLAWGRFERLFLLHKRGMVDPLLWESWQKWAAETWFSSPLARTCWEQEGQFYSREFQELVNVLLQDRPLTRAA